MPVDIIIGGIDLNLIFFHPILCVKNKIYTYEVNYERLNYYLLLQFMRFKICIKYFLRKENVDQQYAFINMQNKLKLEILRMIYL